MNFYCLGVYRDLFCFFSFEGPLIRPYLLASERCEVVFTALGKLLLFVVFLFSHVYRWAVKSDFVLTYQPKPSRDRNSCTQSRPSCSGDVFEPFPPDLFGTHRKWKPKEEVVNSVDPKEPQTQANPAYPLLQISALVQGMS